MSIPLVRWPSWTDTILNAATDLSVSLRVTLLREAGGLAFEGGFYPRVHRLDEASLAAWREAGTSSQVAELLTRLGHTILREHGYESAVSCLEKAFSCTRS